MAKTDARRAARIRRHERIRKTLNGTPERPRLSVYRSNVHIYAQVIDDTKGVTLLAASSSEAGFTSAADEGKVGAAKVVGETIAQRAQEAGIKAVVFDRGGNRYAGRVAALAQAARDNGLEF